MIFFLFSSISEYYAVKPYLLLNSKLNGGSHKNYKTPLFVKYVTHDIWNSILPVDLNNTLYVIFNKNTNNSCNNITAVILSAIIEIIITASKQVSII